MSANNYFECKQSEESDDRSSVSSIPWNSDAINQNKILWEKIERLLHDEEPLSDDNELRQEILDWQAKFPQLAKKEENGWRIKQSSFNISSTNISEILDCDSSLDDNDFVKDNPNQRYLSPDRNSKPRKSQRIESSKITMTGELADVFRKDLHITPLRLRQRKSARQFEKSIFSTSSTDSAPAKKIIKHKNTPNNNTYHMNSLEDSSTIVGGNSRFHMPPILNVIESKRRFCALGNNRSFVQLTKVQQAKSAAHSTARPSPSERRYHIWNKPLAAVTVRSQFLNNRNAIILPAIHHEPITTTATSSNQSELNSFSNSNSSINSSDVRGRQRMHHCLSNSRTTTTTATRSISAMPIHGAFYHL